MLSRQAFLKTAAIGTAAAFLPMSAASSVKTFSGFSPYITKSGYTARFLQQSHDYGATIVVGIECRKDNDIRRHGILCDAESQVPKVKLMLLDWANTL